MLAAVLAPRLLVLQARTSEPEPAAAHGNWALQPKSRLSEMWCSPEPYRAPLARQDDGSSELIELALGQLVLRRPLVQARLLALRPVALVQELEPIPQQQVLSQLPGSLSLQPARQPSHQKPEKIDRLEQVQE